MLISDRDMQYQRFSFYKRGHDSKNIRANKYLVE
jgi:hypothetical protein